MSVLCSALLPTLTLKLRPLVYQKTAQRQWKKKQKTVTQEIYLQKYNKGQYLEYIEK